MESYSMWSGFFCVWIPSLQVSLEFSQVSVLHSFLMAQLILWNYLPLFSHSSLDEQSVHRLSLDTGL